MRQVPDGCSILINMAIVLVTIIVAIVAHERTLSCHIAYTSMPLAFVLPMLPTRGHASQRPVGRFEKQCTFALAVRTVLILASPAMVDVGGSSLAPGSCA
jgi:hypothetical protein